MDVVLQLGKALPARSILFLFQGLALHLELDEAALQTIHLFRL
jgi:hypothetical protein